MRDCSEIIEQLKAGKRVTIRGFGSFTPALRKARTGRNPGTGEPIAIPAKRTVKFKPLFDLGEA